MPKQLGVWIDHRRAVIVELEGAEVSSKTVPSEVDRRRRGGGSRTSVPYGPQDAWAEDRTDRKHAAALKRYYERIAAEVEGAVSLYLFGPGEAKGEFAKVLDEMGRAAPPIARIDAADKMTDPQVVAHVRRFFEEDASHATSRST